MIAVIIGESGSGKSEYAENFLLELSQKNRYEKKYYIATMKPYGKDALERIRRHHRLRAGKGFITVECYSDIKNCDIEPDSNVLLECMSNLIANEMFDDFDKEKMINNKEMFGKLDNNNNKEFEIYSLKKKAEIIFEKVCSELEVLNKKAANLVIVTNDIFSDGVIYDESTTEYIKLLGKVNKYLADICDKCVEVVYSCPVILKEEG